MTTINLEDALEVVQSSDPGMVRQQNEDAVASNAALGVVILADGMGGHNAGEVASGMAITMLKTEMERRFAERDPSAVVADGRPYAHDVLAEEIARANTAIFQAARSQPQYSGMGTTLVAAVFHDNRVTVAHVGDSRLYRMRNGEFTVVTKDHSLLQEQIDAGMLTPEQARVSHNKNLVTRALGVDPIVVPDVQTLDVLVGDIYLLCSDGLNDMVEDDEIGMRISMLAANMSLAATQLVQAANDNGGRDNVSVILVKVKQEFGATRGWLARVKAMFAGWFK